MNFFKKRAIEKRIEAQTRVVKEFAKAYAEYKDKENPSMTHAEWQTKFVPDFLFPASGAVAATKEWVGLNKETMLFIIAKHTHLKMRYYEDETKTAVIDEHVEVEQLVHEVEAWLKEKNNAV